MKYEPCKPYYALVGEFQRECRIVRKGMDGDLHKVCLTC